MQFQSAILLHLPFGIINCTKKAAISDDLIYFDYLSVEGITFCPNEGNRDCPTTKTLINPE